MSRAGDDGVEDTLPAKKHIFHTGNGLDIHGAGAFHSSQIAGIHNDLLSSTNLRIYEIALLVGYNEHSHFVRAFKSVTGKSPGEFRESSS